MTETKTRQEPLAAPDLREKGRGADGIAIFSERRLFMSLTVFGGCRDFAPLVESLKAAKISAVLYADFLDPRGAAVLAMSESPDFFVGDLRALLNAGPFSDLELKPGRAMAGRTYSMGYESNLEDRLIARPKRVLLDQAWPWAVWYPLRRTGAFSALPLDEQGRILREHGVIGRSFGEADLARDIRLDCRGMDLADNDFIIGLSGQALHPLSALVAAMRPTKQTSAYVQGMGPFFVGKAVWQSKEARS